MCCGPPCWALRLQGRSGTNPWPTYCSPEFAQPSRRQSSRSVIFEAGKTLISTDGKSRLIPGQGMLGMLTRNRSSTPKFSGI